MKRGGLILTSLSLLIALSTPALLFADESTVDLESKILDSFDPGPDRQQWFAEGSNYITAGYPQWTFTQGGPEALYGSDANNPSHQVLGVHFKFDRQGYNSIDVFPVAKDSNGNLVAAPIQIPGRVQTLDVWAWGTNHDYYLDVELEDYTGVVHTLHLGSLDYAGWKDLIVTVPTSIPQSVNTIPKLKGLKFLKFVIWTQPTADVSDYYIYFDQLKVLTDMFETRIDGEDLATPEETQKIWSSPDVNKAQ